MKLLLDQGLPRMAVHHLAKLGIEATHVSELGLSTATDSRLIEVGRSRGECVVTLDADFHALMALSGDASPSIIRIRIDGLNAAQLAGLLANVIRVVGADIAAGAAVSVTEKSIRVRKLPLGFPTAD